MVQIVLLVLGVFAIIRMPRLMKVRAEDYPEVDAEAFRRWRSAEMSSAIWLIVASWGVFFIQLGAGLIAGIALGVTHSSKDTIDRASMLITVGGLALFFIMLVPAAIYGSKAKKLKEQANIRWPKKG